MIPIDFVPRMLGRMLKLLTAAMALLAACFVLLLITSAEAQAENAYTAEVIRLVNEERSKAGVPALKQHDSLSAAADVRAEEAARSFSHTRPNGSKWKTVFDEHSIQAYFRGENLAFGQQTPKAVVDDWMASTEHRKNILNSEFDHIAVGMYERAGVLYWSQLFIQSASAPIEAMAWAENRPAGAPLEAVAWAENRPAGAPLEAVAGAEDPAAAPLEAVAGATAQSTAEPATETVSVGDYVRVINTTNLNVRSFVGTEAKIVAVAELGSVLVVLEIKSGWAYVRMSDGTEGWVSTKYLAVHSEV